MKKILFLVGPPASGKSTLAREIYREAALEKYKFSSPNCLSDLKTWAHKAPSYDIKYVSKRLHTSMLEDIPYHEEFAIVHFAVSPNTLKSFKETLGSVRKLVTPSTEDIIILFLRVSPVKNFSNWLFREFSCGWWKVLNPVKVLRKLYFYLYIYDIEFGSGRENELIDFVVKSSNAKLSKSYVSYNR